MPKLLLLGKLVLRMVSKQIFINKPSGSALSAVEMACGSQHSQQPSQQSMDNYSPDGTYVPGTLRTCHRHALSCPSPPLFSEALGLRWRLYFLIDLPAAGEERGAAALQRFRFHKPSQVRWDFCR